MNFTLGLQNKNVNVRLSIIPILIFTKVRKPEKIEEKKERNAKLPTKICPFSTPKIDGETLITS